MKIIICGEEKNGKAYENLLREFAGSQNEEVEILQTVTGKQLLYHMDSHTADVDLVYLEYELPDRNGIEVAKELRKRGVQTDIVIFSESDVHVQDGYDVDAIYFIVQPTISDGKFREIFLKALGRARQRNRQYLSLFCAGESRRIDVSLITYFEVKNRIVTVHYGRNEQFEFYSTLSRLEEVLFGKGFIRIHQAFLASKRYIRQVNKNSVTLSDGTELPVGRSYQGKNVRAFEQKGPKLS